MVRKSRPWSAYALRILCSALMFVSAFGLLAGSTFAQRMRGDFPVETLVLGACAVLAFAPLLFGRKYLGALLVSAFLIAGIGGYWWTTIPWDEFIKDSGFPTPERADLWDYALVASPVVVAAFYAVVSRPSVLRADLKNRGADMDEIRSAASTSFLAGAALLVVCLALSVAMWALMASGIVFAAVAPIPTGIPALILVAMLVAVSWFLLSPRGVPRFRARKAAAKPTATPTRQTSPQPMSKPTLRARFSRRKMPS